MELLSLACFFLGLGYAVISGLYCEVFTGGGDGADSSDPADVRNPPPPAGRISLVSPVVIALFLSGFGGAGVILGRMGWSPAAQIPVAAACGIGIAGLVLVFRNRVFARSDGS